MATRSTVDQDAARELELYIDNDRRIYENATVPIVRNLATKKARGEYRHDLGIKAFENLANFGARNYVREHGSFGGPKWSDMFSVATRRLVAERFADDFVTEYNLGNFNEYIPLKYRSNAPTPRRRRR